MSIFLFVFIWGTKRKLTRLGFVADFCPICRKVRPFSLSEVSRARHVYYIPFDRKFVGYLSKCQFCNLNLSANPNFYQTINKSLSSDLLDLNSLIQETFPNLNQHYRDRLEVEELIKRNPQSLPTATRSAMIKEPFHLLSPLVEAILSSDSRSIRWDRKLFFSFLIFSFFVMMLFGIYIIWWNTTMGQPSLVFQLLLFLVLCVYITIILPFQAKQSELEREVIPLLIKCLKPLNPSLNELKACLNKLASQNQRIGRRLNAQKLLTAIEHL